jgi:hypothetical protein
MGRMSIQARARPLIVVLLVGTLVIASLLTACTSPQVATPGDGTPTELRLEAGDTIRVVTKHREGFSFEKRARRANVWSCRTATSLWSRCAA